MERQMERQMEHLLTDAYLVVTVNINRNVPLSRKRRAVPNGTGNGTLIEKVTSICGRSRHPRSMFVVNGTHENASNLHFKDRRGVRPRLNNGATDATNVSNTCTEDFKKEAPRRMPRK